MILVVAGIRFLIPGSEFWCIWIVLRSFIKIKLYNLLKGNTIDSLYGNADCRTKIKTYLFRIKVPFKSFRLLKAIGFKCKLESLMKIVSGSFR